MIAFRRNVREVLTKNQVNFIFYLLAYFVKIWPYSVNFKFSLLVPLFNLIFYFIMQIDQNLHTHITLLHYYFTVPM